MRLVSDTVELRPVSGLVQKLPLAEIEILAVKAIRLHREILATADSLLQGLPDSYKTGEKVGGTQHLQYIEKMIEMHAQMSAVSSLIAVLGYTPKIPND